MEVITRVVIGLSVLAFVLLVLLVVGIVLWVTSSSSKLSDDDVRKVREDDVSNVSVTHGLDALNGHRVMTLQFNAQRLFDIVSSSAVGVSLETTWTTSSGNVIKHMMSSIPPPKGTATDMYIDNVELTESDAPDPVNWTVSLLVKTSADVHGRMFGPYEMGDNAKSRWQACDPGDVTSCSENLVCNSLLHRCLSPGNNGSTCALQSDCATGLVCDITTCKVSDVTPLEGHKIFRQWYGDDPQLTTETFPRVFKTRPLTAMLTIETQAAIDVSTSLVSTDNLRNDGFSYIVERHKPYPPLLTPFHMEGQTWDMRHNNLSIMELHTNLSVSYPVYGIGMSNDLKFQYAMMLDPYGYRYSVVNIVTPFQPQLGQTRSTWFTDSSHTSPNLIAPSLIYSQHTATSFTLTIVQSPDTDGTNPWSTPVDILTRTDAVLTGGPEAFVNFSPLFVAFTWTNTLTSTTVTEVGTKRSGEPWTFTVLSSSLNLVLPQMMNLSSGDIMAAFATADVPTEIVLFRRSLASGTWSTVPERVTTIGNANFTLKKFAGIPRLFGSKLNADETTTTEMLTATTTEGHSWLSFNVPVVVSTGNQVLVTRVVNATKLILASPKSSPEDTNQDDVEHKHNGGVGDDVEGEFMDERKEVEEKVQTQQRTVRTTRTARTTRTTRTRTRMDQSTDLFSQITQTNDNDENDDDDAHDDDDNNDDDNVTDNDNNTNSADEFMLLWQEVSGVSPINVSSGYIITRDGGQTWEKQVTTEVSVEQLVTATPPSVNIVQSNDLAVPVLTLVGKDDVHTRLHGVNDITVHWNVS
jgi:hypothetical protein